MDGPVSAVREITQILAKTNPPPHSAPPAYTPSGHIDLRTVTARQLQQARATQPTPVLVDRSPMATFLSGSAMVDDQDDSEDGLSAISLRINTSITVSSNDNMVCLAETPADHANAIAEAVVKAVQQHSSGQCGIPMIDEEGRPRPIRIEVDAGLTVEGTGNVIGKESIVAEVLRQRGQTLRRRRQKSEEDDEDAAGPSKRRRPSE
ncbi:hypothetical protein TOPH_00203 [Tolypocladium ophioglossoides CBS 100239]|uniref:Uncharacterized protein n=1 Tax=Tolypocladium ophioglossoides (strain CBS 100239) TaxID=1163406 RepID=A0A0L0NMP9_TOLOC|nr:hypothetical protein TOPH_00203 [Tolypocladium ophioglossoides CBS 100239]